MTVCFNYNEFFPDFVQFIRKQRGQTGVIFHKDVWDMLKWLTDTSPVTIPERFAGPILAPFPFRL